MPKDLNDCQGGSYSRRDFIKAGAAVGVSGLFGGCTTMGGNPSPAAGPADTILLSGKIATQDERRSVTSALAIRDGRIYATGDDATAMAYRGAATRVVELNGRTVIPGLIDSHAHPIRRALYYNLKLPWHALPPLPPPLPFL